MAKTRKDEAYERGVHDGLRGTILDDLGQANQLPWPASDTDDAYDKGYEWGAEHRHHPNHKVDSDDDDGCFISSACTRGRGLPDNCHELTVLRRYRTWLEQSPAGRRAVDQYRREAPAIVRAIDQHVERADIYKALYRGLVSECVRLIEQGDRQQAFDRYRSIFLELRERYGPREERTFNTLPRYLC